jgi:hypothetical protein
MASRLSASPPSIAASRTPWSWRIAVALATLVAGALFAFTLAFWGWRWLGPTPVVAPVADKVPEPWAPAIVAAAPFGRSVATAAPPPAGVPQSTGLPADTRLLGIFAGRDGEGYALLRLPDRGAILVSRGQDIVSGVTVEAIHADRIDINDRGQRRDMPLHHADAIAPHVRLRRRGR